MKIHVMFFAYIKCLKVTKLCDVCMYEWTQPYPVSATNDYDAIRYLCWTAKTATNNVRWFSFRTTTATTLLLTNISDKIYRKTTITTTKIALVNVLV